jgi:hypothetical protein
LKITFLTNAGFLAADDGFDYTKNGFGARLLQDANVCDRGWNAAMAGETSLLSGRRISNM